MLETRPVSPLNVKVPESFSTRKAAGQMIEGVWMDILPIPEGEVGEMKEIHQLLKSQALARLIDKEQVTFAMIKPNASEGQGLPEDDDEAALAILDQIGHNAVLALPFQFREQDARRFYENLADRPTIYDEVVDYTTSGPLTAVLIHKPDARKVFPLGEGKEFRDGSAVVPGGLFVTRHETVQLTDDLVVVVKSGKPKVVSLSEMTEEEKIEYRNSRVYYRVGGRDKVKIESAVGWWRDRMGDTNPDLARLNNPESIRARFAKGMPKNLVHGSDSPESVRRELAILDDAIVDLLSKNGGKTSEYDLAS